MCNKDVRSWTPQILLSHLCPLGEFLSYPVSFYPSWKIVTPIPKDQIQIIENGGMIMLITSREVSHKPNVCHPTHCPIDLSSRNVTPEDEATLLSKRPSFCPVPRDINWHKCRLDWQSFVDKIRWADFHFDRNSGDVSNNSFILDEYKLFYIKTHKNIIQYFKTAWATNNKHFSDEVHDQICLQS